MEIRIQGIRKSRIRSNIRNKIRNIDKFRADSVSACTDTTPAVVGAASESIYLIQTRLRYSPVLVSIWTLSP